MSKQSNIFLNEVEMRLQEEEKITLELQDNIQQLINDLEKLEQLFKHKTNNRL